MCCCLVYLFPSFFNKNASSTSSSTKKRPSQLPAQTPKSQFNESETLDIAEKSHNRRSESLEINSSNVVLNLYPETSSCENAGPNSPVPLKRPYNSILKKRNTLDAAAFEITPVRRDEGKQTIGAMAKRRLTK